MMWWHNGGDGQWALMTVITILILGLVVAFAIRVARSSPEESDRSNTALPAQRSGAESLLAERFARGEIDEDEFTRCRKVLHPTSENLLTAP